MSHSNRGKGRRKFTVDALFQDTSTRGAGVRDLIDAKEIDIERIVPDPNQPRQTFDQDALQELADSIRKEGVLQPVAVRYDEAADQYVILHGERRWRASQLAELTSIPAIVRDVPEERRLVQQLMENVVREDLNAVDRAAALRLLKRQMDNAPWERVAEAVGIRRSRLFQLLSTEKLADSIQDRIRTGELSEKQTRSLQGFAVPVQETLAELLLDGANEKQIQAISRQLREEEDHLEMEPEQLREHVHAVRDTVLPRGEDRPPANAGDPVISSLMTLIGDSDLPDDRQLALELAEQRLGSTGDDVSRQVHQIALVLGRIASGDDDEHLSTRQLTALKQLADHALRSRRGRR